MNDLADETLLNDTDLCKLLKISKSTLYDQLKRPHSDIHLLKQVKVSGHRRWSRKSVREFIEGGI